jgi:hypothetical protein
MATDEGNALLVGHGGISRVARRCGVSRSFVSHIVNGRSRYSKTLNRISSSTPPMTMFAAERERLESVLQGHVHGMIAVLTRLAALGAIEELHRRTLAFGERLATGDAPGRARGAVPGRGPRPREGSPSPPAPSAVSPERDASRGQGEAVPVRRRLGMMTRKASQRDRAPPLCPGSVGPRRRRPTSRGGRRRRPTTIGRTSTRGSGASDPRSTEACKPAPLAFAQKCRSRARPSRTGRHLGR